MGVRQSASTYATMSALAARRAVSRATTNLLQGSSSTRTPGTARAIAPVSSVLALLMTRISSGGRVCARRE